MNSDGYDKIYNEVNHPETEPRKEMYQIQPDKDIIIKGGWRITSHITNEEMIRNKKLPALPTYDIITYDQYGDEVSESRECIGNKSLKFWWDYRMKVVRRLAILTEDLEMAQHNARCYHNKPEYENEYNEEMERVELLNTWIIEIRNGAIR